MCRCVAVRFYGERLYLFWFMHKWATNWPKTNLCVLDWVVTRARRRWYGLFTITCVRMRLATRLSAKPLALFHVCVELDAAVEKKKKRKTWTLSGAVQSKAGYEMEEYYECWRPQKCAVYQKLNRIFVQDHRIIMENHFYYYFSFLCHFVY